jgi:hypothetical protein
LLDAAAEQFAKTPQELLGVVTEFRKLGSVKVNGATVAALAILKGWRSFSPATVF